MARILVIDDDEQMRRLVRRVLENANHTILEAGDGDSGLLVLAREAVDLVITDIIMPDKEGIETIREIRRKHGAVKILAISGGGQIVHMDVLTAAGRLGANRTLPKPFSPAVLSEIVSELLNEATPKAR
jgi:DNA-binding response OmpR family regulator